MSDNDCRKPPDLPPLDVKPGPDAWPEVMADVERVDRRVAAGYAAEAAARALGLPAILPPGAAPFAALLPDMRARHERGLREYGKPLRPFLVDTLRYLYEEELDAVVYAWTHAHEHKKGTEEYAFFFALYRLHLVVCTELRARLTARGA